MLQIMEQVPSAAHKPAPPKRLTKGDWLDAGLTVLGRKGAGGVRIDAICKQLGVTKGSFYWHFTDRGDLMTSIVEHWDNQATERMIASIESATDDPKARLWHLVHNVTLGDYDVGIEVAMRQWAHEDPTIRTRLEGIDAKRIAFFQRQFQSLGFVPDAARLRAHTLYSVILVREYMHTGEARAALAQRMQASVDLLTQGPHTPAP